MRGPVVSSPGEKREEPLEDTEPQNSEGVVHLTVRRMGVDPEGGLSVSLTESVPVKVDATLVPVRYLHIMSEKNTKD